MKSVLALFMVASLCFFLAACGKAGEIPTSASQTSSVRNSLAAIKTADASPALRHLKGDDDDDDLGENNTSPNIVDTFDSDQDNDGPKHQHRGYYDPDDTEVTGYGHAASAGEERALSAFVKRYLAAAAAHDGIIACSMIRPSLASSVVEDYGEVAGPAYLRGNKSCHAVLSRLFEHERRRLAGRFVVTAVRVKGKEALVLLGSKVTPALFFSLERVGDAWKTDGLLPLPLP